MNKKFWLCLVLVFSLTAVLQVACRPQERRVKQEGYSMLPNFRDGDIFAIIKIPLDKMKRGDLVLIKTDKSQILKRIIGLPNETISITDGKIFINGVVLVESYEVTPIPYTVDEINLENDSYFVLGDNRANSSDSHIFGPIKGSAIEGRAIPLMLTPEK